MSGYAMKKESDWKLTTGPATRNLRYIMEGTGSVQVNNEQAALRAGDTVPILLNDEQSFVNNTSEDLELLVIGVAWVKGVLDPAGF